MSLKTAGSLSSDESEALIVLLEERIHIIKDY